MVYSFCHNKPASYCPASGLCEELRLTMWDGVIADRAHEGEDRRQAVMAAIGKAAAQAGLEPPSSDIARLAMSAMHISAGNCAHDRIS